MSYIIKAGSWIEKRHPLKGELDLDWLISTIIPPGSSVWGGITGTLSDQADLQAALNDKLNSTFVVNTQILQDDVAVTFNNNTTAGMNSQFGISTTGTITASVTNNNNFSNAFFNVNDAVNPSTSFGVYNDVTGESSTVFLSSADLRVRILSDAANFAGAEYNSDFSSNYNNRSLTDKGYVDAAVSDQRLKENVENLTDSTSKILQLRPVEFDFIATKKHEVGFIAQEIEKVFPDMVVKDDGEYLKVKRFDLIPHLVKTIQELEARIKILESR